MVGTVPPTIVVAKGLFAEAWIVSATLLKPKLQAYLFIADAAVGYSLKILKSCACFTVDADDALTKT